MTLIIKKMKMQGNAQRSAEVLRKRDLAKHFLNKFVFRPMGESSSKNVIFRARKARKSRKKPEKAEKFSKIFRNLVKLHFFNLLIIVFFVILKSYWFFYHPCFLGLSKAKLFLTSLVLRGFCGHSSKKMYKKLYNFFFNFYLIFLML